MVLAVSGFIATGTIRPYSCINHGPLARGHSTVRLANSRPSCMESHGRWWCQLLNRQRDAERQDQHTRQHVFVQSGHVRSFLSTVWC